MRKACILFTLVALLLVGVVAVVSAQEDDPSLCFNGTWYCPDAGDSAREAWNWTCGWYWGEYYARNISVAQLPEYCNPPADTDGDGVGDDLDLCPTEGGDVDEMGCPIVVVPVTPTTCQIQIGTFADAIGLTVNPVTVPLDVINGLAVGDLDDGIGWRGANLAVNGPAAPGYWGSIWPVAGTWGADVIFTDCPTPTAPVT